jgi:hypothetical protein
MQRRAASDQAYILEQAALETERGELSSLNTQLKAARAELDKINKTKQAANANPYRSPYYLSTGTAPPTSHTSYYRAYTTPYAYTPAYTIPPASTTPATVPPPPPPPAIIPTAATPAATTTVPITPNAAIPVQLPVSSLPNLHALGIYPTPAPATSFGPDGQAIQNPQAAVLKGSSHDGTMLHLEINVSLLQQHQMSGLAVLLNTIIKRNASSGSSAASSASPNPPASAVASEVGS